MAASFGPFGSITTSSSFSFGSASAGAALGSGLGESDGAARTDAGPGAVSVVATRPAFTPRPGGSLSAPHAGHAAHAAATSATGAGERNRARRRPTAAAEPYRESSGARTFATMTTGSLPVLGALGLAAPRAAGSTNARANGVFPTAGQVVIDPSDPLHLVVRTTYGVLTTRTGATPWDWLCETGVGYGSGFHPAV